MANLRAWTKSTTFINSEFLPHSIIRLHLVYIRVYIYIYIYIIRGIDIILIKLP